MTADRPFLIERSTTKRSAILPRRSDSILINTLAYVDRGLAYDNRGNYEKAVSDYTEAIRLESNYVAAYVGGGNIYLRTGNRAEANADFATAKRLEAGQ